MSLAAHTDLQISLGIFTDLELRSSFMLYSTQGGINFNIKEGRIL